MENAQAGAAPKAAPESVPPDTGPDVEPAGDAGRPSRGARAGQLPVVCAVAIGGGLGAATRCGLSLRWPTAAGAFPWTTLVINVWGCAVIGVFMVVITDVRAAHRLVRPFFGTGVLGGFTTFSTYVVDAQRLVERRAR